MWYKGPRLSLKIKEKTLPQQLSMHVVTLLAHWQAYQCHPPNAVWESLLSYAICNYLPLPVRPSWPSCFWLMHSGQHASMLCPASILAAGGLRFFLSPGGDKASLKPLGMLFFLFLPLAFIVKVSDLANARNSAKVLKQWDAVYIWITI